MSIAPAVAWQFRSWPPDSDEMVIGGVSKSWKLEGYSNLAACQFVTNDEGPMFGQPADTVMAVGFEFTRHSLDGYTWNITLARHRNPFVKTDQRKHRIYDGGLNHKLLNALRKCFA